MSSTEEKLCRKLEKKERIIKIRKSLSELSEEQRQAIADKFGVITVEGHLLTPYNQCFLVAQSEINFTVVGGFQQWKKAGRVVRKGEHGFLIFVPSKTKQELVSPQGGDNSEMISDDEDVHFFTATVFDISQTEAIAKSEAA